MKTIKLPCIINNRTEPTIGVETQSGPGGIKPPNLENLVGPRDLCAKRHLPTTAGGPGEDLCCRRPRGGSRGLELPDLGAPKGGPKACKVFCDGRHLPKNVVRPRGRRATAAVARRWPSEKQIVGRLPPWSVRVASPSPVESSVGQGVAGP